MILRKTTAFNIGDGLEGDFRNDTGMIHTFLQSFATL